MKAHALSKQICPGSSIIGFVPAQRLPNGEIVELPTDKPGMSYLSAEDAIAAAKRYLGL